MGMLQEFATSNGFYIKHYVRPYVLCKLTMIWMIKYYIVWIVVTFALETFIVEFTRQLLVLEW